MARPRKCRKCGSTDISYRVVKVAETTYSARQLKKKRGCLWMMTVGPFVWMWNLGKKKKPKTSSVRVSQHSTLAMCRNCGHRWYVD